MLLSHKDASEDKMLTFQAIMEQIIIFIWSYHGIDTRLHEKLMFEIWVELNVIQLVRADI